MTRLPPVDAPIARQPHTRIINDELDRFQMRLQSCLHRQRTVNGILQRLDFRLI